MRLIGLLATTTLLMPQLATASSSATIQYLKFTGDLVPTDLTCEDTNKSGIAPIGASI
jgi:hypothetical protein